jgi:hypothetical protein
MRLVAPQEKIDPLSAMPCHAEVPDATRHSAPTMYEMTVIPTKN